MRKLSVLFLLTLSLLPAALPVLAQSGASPQMDSALQQNGKIYVVVAVLVVIFIGIVLFLIRMERRISRMEKDQRSASS
ncbi:CcmD family protein [Compostibacter hankyongensis]|uniref:CcmD family protein n=1 Tax=Compostibacter hankyongensis TaxID=1007089 RepID=A0ABP8FHW3_9BACT